MASKTSARLINPNMSPSTNCPTHDELYEYALSQGKEYAELKPHIESCPLCQKAHQEILDLEKKLFNTLPSSSIHEPTAKVNPTRSLTIGGYHLLEELGQGGMGKVYKAKDPKLDRLVALKVIKQELSSNLDFKKRFEREAKIIAQLNHPNIVQIHQF